MTITPGQLATDANGQGTQDDDARARALAAVQSSYGVAPGDVDLGASEPEKKKNWFARFGKDLGLMIPREIINFGNETVNFLNDTMTGTAQILNKVTTPLADMHSYFKPVDAMVDFFARDSDALNLPQVVGADYDTGVGSFLGTMARFGIGMVTLQGPRKAGTQLVASQAAKRFPALMRVAARNPRLAQAAGIMGTGAVEGATLDVVIFDPDEDTLAEMVESWGGGGAQVQALAEWLSTDEFDSSLQKRAKNAVEGMLVGAAFDSVWQGLKAFRALRKARKAAESGDKEALGLARREATAALDAMDEAKAPKETDVVEVVELDDGTAVVVDKGTDPEDLPRKGRIARLREQGAVLTEQEIRTENVTALKMTIPPDEAAQGIRRYEIETPEGVTAELDMKVEGKTLHIFNVEVTSTVGGERVGKLGRKAVVDMRAALVDIYGVESFSGLRTGGSMAVEGPRPIKKAVVKGEKPTEPTMAEMMMHVTDVEDVPTAPVRGQYDTPEAAHRSAAVINDIAQTQHRPRGLSEEQQMLVVSMVDEFHNAPTQELRQAVLQKYDFNVGRLATTDDRIAVINAVSMAFDGLPGGRVTRSLKETEQMAMNLIDGTSRTQLVESLAKDARLVGSLDARVNAYRWLLVNQSGQVDRAAKQFFNSPTDTLLDDALAYHLDVLFDIADMTAAVQGGIGRALGSLRIKAGKLTAEAMAEASQAGRRSLKDMTARQRMDVARKVRVAGGNPKTIQKIITSEQMIAKAKHTIDDRTAFEKFVQGMHRYQINGMLSSPATHIVNFVSNVTKAIARPTANIIGGVLTRSGASTQFGLDQFTMSVNALGESFKMGWRAFRTGEASIDPFRSISELDDYMARKSRRSGGSKLANFYHDAVDLPMRGLIGADVVFKQIAYRADLGARALAEARAAGHSGDAALFRSNQAINDSFSMAGEGLDEKSLQAARKQTFQQDLGPMGQSIQEFIGRIPYGLGRLVVPFIRTPTNIFKSTMEHTPLAALSKNVRADMAAGGQRKAEAIGQMALGSGVMAGSYTMFLSGNLTGGGPQDPRLRASWLMDNQPYSVKMPGTDRWVSYKRLEPFSSLMGILADAHEAAGEAVADDLDFKQVSEAVGLAVLASMKDKTYASNIMEFMSATLGGETQGDAFNKFIGRLSTRAIPYSAALRATAKGTDQYLRLTRTILDEWRAALPGFSHTLPVRRNILGEPILRTPRNTTVTAPDFQNMFNNVTNPFTVSRPFDDEVGQVLAELGNGWSMPSEQLGSTDISLTDPKYRDPDTGMVPYDRWMELVEKQNPRERIEKLVASQRFKKASGDTSMQRGGKQYLLLSGEINRAQGRALRQLYREYPELKKDQRDWGRRKRAAITGGAEALERLLEERGR